MARLPIIAILAAGIAGFAGFQPEQAAALDYLVFVSGDCGSAASRVVRETGGELLSAQPGADGQTCTVTVLIQGKGNERPRKVTKTVPM